VKIPESSLRSKDEKTSNENVEDDGRGRRPPNDGVSNEVDLSVVLDPEVLCSHRRRRRDGKAKISRRVGKEERKRSENERFLVS